MWLWVVDCTAMLYTQKALDSNNCLVFICDYATLTLLKIFIHKTGTILP